MKSDDSEIGYKIDSHSREHSYNEECVITGPIAHPSINHKGCLRIYTRIRLRIARLLRLESAIKNIIRIIRRVQHEK